MKITENKIFLVLILSLLLLSKGVPCLHQFYVLIFFRILEDRSAGIVVGF